MLHQSRDLSRVCGPFLAHWCHRGAPCAGALQQDRLNPDALDLLALQLFEHLVQHARLGSAMHAGVDRVTVAKPLGRSSPFAAVLGHIPYRVDRLKVGHAHVALLGGQIALNTGKLLG